MPALYKEPEEQQPPPFWIRCLLILTCTGVSFAHGSNDGQKGMGLIMLILIGTVPTAYALNKAVTAGRDADLRRRVATARRRAAALQRRRGAGRRCARQVDDYVQTKTLAPDAIASLKQLVDIDRELASAAGLRHDRRRAAGHRPQRAQQHVHRVRGAALDGEEEGARA